jgi:hypothetical protein
MILFYYFLLISVTVTVTVMLETITEFCQMFKVETKEDQTFLFLKVMMSFNQIQLKQTFLHTLLSMVMLTQKSPDDLSDRILLTKISDQTV